MVNKPPISGPAITHDGTGRRDQPGRARTLIMREVRRHQHRRHDQRGPGTFEHRPLELPARLQHHGAAIRLLDCSGNAFVALWLACRWEPDKDGVLIGFELGENAVHLNTEMLRHGLDDLLAMAAGRLLCGNREVYRRASPPSRLSLSSGRCSTSRGDRSSWARARSASTSVRSTGQHRAALLP